MDFENRRGDNRPDFFPDVDSRFKFSVLVVGGAKRPAAKALCGFFLRGREDVANPQKCFQLTPREFTLVNPNTGTAPIFRSKRDADLTTAIYGRVPVLVDLSSGTTKSVWPVEYSTMFHMTNDSALFWTADRLRDDGAYPSDGNKWKKGQTEFVPLYEGKMVQAFDHRAASVVINPDNVHRPAQPEPTTIAQHEDPSWTPMPQFWVDTKEVAAHTNLAWVLGFKEITAHTNVRTVISALLPGVAFGNKMPLLVPSSQTDQKAANTAFAPILCANLNSIIFDFVSRQKVHGQTLNWFLVQQLPVIDAGAYKRRIGKRVAEDIVRNHVLQLTYVAHDMAAFARDMGYTHKSGEAKPPFKWDDEERRHLRARLDALYFLLYGVTNRKDVSYILDTFPIVRADDERAFAGRYRTKELILAYMSALEAGDVDTVVAA
ncbi:MAG: hypothetical protein ACKVRO_18865 [Micropepsaceae bacterium]